MPLTKEAQKRYRAIGHKLKPVVSVAGKGLTDGVIAELHRALEDHELIKIKLDIDDRVTRAALRSELCSKVGAEPVQDIGKVSLIFRASKEPKIKTSNIR